MRSIAPTLLAAALLATAGGTAQAHHQRLVLQLTAPPLRRVDLGRPEVSEDLERRLSQKEVVLPPQECHGRRSLRRIHRADSTAGTPPSNATVTVPCRSVRQTSAPVASIIANVEGTGWP